MMPSRSTPNLQQQATRDTKNNHAPSIYSYLHNQSGLNFAPVSTSPTRNEESPPPAPPVRDSSSLKSVKYGPGHEKFPSWPVPAAAEAPQALRAPPSGGSHRSKSWTDHTNYPKEKVVTYTRPYMKRQNSSHIQQKLKTVMEKCEKIPLETYESHFDKINDRLYLPHVDRDGKALGDMEYNVPSPPERDVNKPQLTQEELEEYARSYQESSIEKYGHYNPDMKGLENFIEYARSYEEYHINQKHDATVLTHLHQKQLSYAQSEGYHSYVSSADSTSTPFLDRLRRDSEAVPARQSDSWDDITESDPANIRREGRDSVVTTSSGSASSSETLKWHGSMSDVSVASSSHLANSSISSVQRQQLIAHSARVQTPQRHHSESVLYMGGENQENWKDRENRNNNTNKLKLFAVNTYTVQSNEHNNLQQVLTQPQQVVNRTTQPSLSVADRINELEKQQKYSYLDPDKKHKVPDPTLKAIQKKALLSFYERHHNSSSTNPNSTNKANTWRSEPQLAQSQSTLVQAPQPPPRIKAQTPTRRASCASDYASNNNSKRSSFASSRENRESGKVTPRHQHSNSCGSLSTDLLGPVIVGPSISLDDWVPQKPPERPPKNPHLRIAYPGLFQDQRVPSPDLPPPSPPTVLEDEVINSDEPLPPPPTELENSVWQPIFDDRLKENRTGYQSATAQVETSHKTAEDALSRKELCLELPRKSTIGIPERGSTRYSSVRHVPNEHRLKISESRHHLSDIKDGINDKCAHSDNRHVGDSRLIEDKHRHLTDGLLHNESRHSQNDNSKKHASDIRLSSDNRSFAVENTDRYKSPVKEQPVFGFPNQRNYAERSSTRYPPMHKLILNGNVAISQKIVNGVCDQYRAEPLRSVPLKDDDKLLAVSSIRSNQRASIAEGSPRDIPPPLQPRQMRINQSMRARIPEGRPGGITARTSPLRDEKLRDTKQTNYSMSPSKASYLASRRDRNRIAPDPDTGSYKRTLSPNGHIIAVDVTTQDPPKLNPKDAIWAIKTDKQTIFNNNNSNSTLLRRTSVCDENKNSTVKSQDMKEDLKNQVILPDVLPINAKLAPRSQYPNRPTNLTLPVHMEQFTPTKGPLKSPPSSPPKSPLRNSSYTPLRSTNFSSSPMRTPSMRVSPQTTTSNSPQFINSSTTVSSCIRTFPPQKVLSPTSPSQKMPGLEFRPLTLSLQRSLSADSKPVALPLHRNTSPSLRTSPISFSAKQSPIQSPEQQSPPPLPKSSPPIKSSFTFTPPQIQPQSPDIKPTLSPSLSNKTTPIKIQSPSSTSTNTPLRTTPESSPSSSPEILSLTHMISPLQSPKEPEYPKVIEGLQMIQRTEVILRVNATTIDAASQTDKEELPPTPLPTRRKLQEEIECEKLSEDFVKQLPATDRLKGLLVPAPEHKKLTDYVSGLFRVDVTMKPRPANSPFRSRNNTPSSSPPPVNSINSTTYITTKSSGDSTSVVPSIEPTSPLSATSPYFTTSEPKAKFLTRYSQDMNQYTIKNTKDLNQKKDELVSRLDRKLEVLRSEQLVVSEECRINNELGENVESHLSHVARPHETSKFRLHIEEVGKITSLLLSLSGRLARVENALMGMAEDHPERRILESKRDKLLDQLEEAKKLKESIDRRSVNVSSILYKYLTSEEYADYDHFINMKAKLIMDSKEISDKIKLGEEQLMALKETLIVTD